MGNVAINGRLYDNESGVVAGFVDALGREQGIGRIPIARRQVGSVAAPLVTVTGVATGQFVLPLPIIIPAKLITPGSRLVVETTVKRTGATATALFNTYLGTTGNTVTDSLLQQQTLNATTGHGLVSQVMAEFGSSTTSLRTNGLMQKNNVAAGASMVDLSSSINTQAAMFLTFWLSAANAADSFALLSAEAYLEP